MHEEFRVTLCSVSSQINGAFVVFSGTSTSCFDTRSSKPIDSKFTIVGNKRPLKELLGIIVKGDAAILSLVLKEGHGEDSNHILVNGEEKKIFTPCRK